MRAALGIAHSVLYIDLRFAVLIPITLPLIVHGTCIRDTPMSLERSRSRSVMT